MSQSFAFLRRSKPQVLVILLAACGGIYLVLLFIFEVAATPRELRFGAEPSERRHVALYIEPQSVDAGNDVMQLRISASPGPDLRGRVPATPDSDLTVVISQRGTQQPIVLRAQQTMPTTGVELDFDSGDINDYPFDHYIGAIRLQTLEGADALSESAHTLPVVVTFWEGLHGFRVSATEEQTGAPGDVRLRIEARRSGAFRYFACAAYVAMLVIAAVGLTIGVMTFLGRRRPESTLLGALGAMVFALPTLRNALPGAPPLGVGADMLVFLWAVLATVLSLALFAYSWVRDGSRG